MTDGAKKRILFICTGNSCRSQMAEAVLRHLGGDRFEAFSAGSSPAGFVHALAIETLMAMKVPIDNFVSKSWNEFSDRRMDVVITVCDAAAGEACPVWPGNPIRAHWSLPDPVYHPGDDDERRRFARAVGERIAAKIAGLIAMDWSKPRAELEQALTHLGEI